MSDKINDGGPAFPRRYTPMLEDQPGMSLRDYFAGQALTNTLICESSGKDFAKMNAEYAYLLADAMIAAREGGG